MIAGPLRRLLDRLPHDTLYIGGQVYMRRWYVFGYAPDPEHPDKRMICATCEMTVYPGCSAHDGSGSWTHAAEIMDAGHPPVAVSAARPGWWWRHHRLGAVRIHEIVASDDSRAFHDHPWSFLSILLRGSYVERRPWRVRTVDGVVTQCSAVDDPDGQHLRRRFSAPAINRHDATDLHVLDVDRGPVWTLFLTRPKTRSWGFAGPFGWLGWRSFDEQFPERDAWVEP